MKFNKDMLKLYAITDRQWLKDKTLPQAVEEAIKGGATFIQLREKDTPYDQFKATAIEVKKITDKYNIPFVINDNVELCKEIDADGVHVGADDMSVKKAREILLSAEKQVEDYKIKKEKEIVKLSLEMAKIITNKNFENDESVISLINPVLEQFRGEENIVIKCNGNYIVAIESKVNEWKKSYAISGEILVLEYPLMELGNAVLEKSTGKVVVGLDVSLEKLEESIKEFCGEEDA